MTETRATELKTMLELIRDEPLDIDPAEFKGLFADKMLSRLDAYQTFASESADNAAELEELTNRQDDANRKLAAAPTQAQVDAAYDKYDASFEHGDYVETERLLQEWKDLKAERDAAVKEHAEVSKETAEKLNELAEKQADAVPTDEDGDPTKDDLGERREGDDDWDKDGGGTPAKPSGERTLDDIIDGGGGTTTPTGQTQLSSDAAPVQAQQSGYPTIYPTAQQQPTVAAMPSPSVTPAFNSALNPSPSRAQKDKDKERMRAEEKISPMPVPSPVPTAVPIDRGSSTTGVTTKDVSGRTPQTTLTNAAPGTSTQTAGGRGGVGGGGMVGGGMPGHGGSVGAGNKTTTTSKPTFDQDRTLTRRDDADQTVTAGILSKDSIDAIREAEEAADDEVALRNTAAGDKQKKDDKR